VAANPLDNNGAGKEERREEQAAPRLCMRERLAVESGRLAAMATGEARGSRVGVASGGRERHLVPCAVGIWRGLSNSLERGRGAVCASNGARWRYIMIQRLRI